MAAENIELSERELEILRLVATGASNKEIAQQLVISPNTVKVHLRNIFAKIGVVSRTEATLYAIRHEWVARPALSVSDQELPQPQEAILAEEDLNLIPVSMEIPISQNIDAPEEQPAARSVWLFMRRRAWVWIVLALLMASLTGVGLYYYLSQRPAAASLAASPGQRWQKMATLPAPRSGMAAVVYENQVYIVGGTLSKGVTGTMARFDPASAAWVNLPDKPRPVTDVQAAILGEKIFIPGGRLANGKLTDVLEVYDPRKDVWEQKANVPVAMSGYASATFEGHLFLFGGWDGSRALASVYGYDPAADAWQAYTAMPTPRAFAGAALVNGKVYVVGGTDGSRALAVNEVYYPERDVLGDFPWSVSSSLPAPRYSMGTVVLADMVYLFGGQPEQSAIQYIPSQNKWNAVEDPPVLIGSQPAVVQMGAYCYILGGKNADGQLASTNYSYQAIFLYALPLVR
jgi:DNA-binding CsgD family transcriptional regulator/N-acetylneuraminic acid mutarotase